jgi:hypothetical protein
VCRIVFVATGEIGDVVRFLRDLIAGVLAATLDLNLGMGPLGEIERVGLDLQPRRGPRLATDILCPAELVHLRPDPRRKPI